MISYVDGIDACPPSAARTTRFDSILDTETPDEGGAPSNPRFLAQSLAAAPVTLGQRPAGHRRSAQLGEACQVQVDTQDGTLQVVQMPVRMP